MAFSYMPGFGNDFETETLLAGTVDQTGFIRNH